MSTINITDVQLTAIAAAISESQNRASANTITCPNVETIQSLITSEASTFQNLGKTVKKVLYHGRTLYSKSKDFSTTATQLTLEFYKNGNLKSYSATRASYGNYKCYSGYCPDSVYFY